MTDFFGSFFLFIGVVIVVLYPCFLFLENYFLIKDRNVGSYRRYERADQVSFIKSQRRGASVVIIAFVLILLGEIPFLLEINIYELFENPFDLFKYTLEFVLLHVLALIFIKEGYFNYTFILIDRNKKIISISKQKFLKKLEGTFQFESIANLGIREVISDQKSSTYRTHSCEITFNDRTEFLIEENKKGKDVNLKFLNQIASLLDTTVMDYTKGNRTRKAPSFWRLDRKLRFKSY